MAGRPSTVGGPAVGETTPLLSINDNIGAAASLIENVGATASSADGRHKLSHDAETAAPDTKATWKNLPVAMDSSERALFVWCGPMVSKKAFDAISASLLFFALVLFGGIVFSLLEHPHEVDRIDKVRAIYAQEKREVMALLEVAAANNMTEGTTAELLYERLQLIRHGLEHGPQDDDRWTVLNGCIFTFTVITTIGYGTFTPQTVIGQVFLVFLAILGIPAAGISLAYIADRLMYAITAVTEIGTDKAQAAFEAFDTDGSGELESEELRSALQQLGFELTDHQFKEVFARLDVDGSGTVDFDEFKEATKMLHCDLTEPAGRKKRTKLVLLMIMLWLGLGILCFSLLEGWTPVQAFYFAFVSLTTIGLGDFFPKSGVGLAVLLVFAMVGLGLVAMLLTLVEGLMRELERAAQDRVRTAKEATSFKFIKTIPAFASLTDEQLHSVASNMVKRSYGKNKVICVEGDEAHELHILIYGSVHIAKRDPTSGQDQMLKELKAPDFFGEGSLARTTEKARRVATVTAGSSGCDTLTLSRDDWEMLSTAVGLDFSALQTEMDRRVAEMAVRIPNGVSGEASKDK